MSKKKNREGEINTASFETTHATSGLQNNGFGKRTSSAPLIENRNREQDPVIKILCMSLALRWKYFYFCAGK